MNPETISRFKEQALGVLCFEYPSTAPLSGAPEVLAADLPQQQEQ